jgi:periplasmic glucans biosynthesis protein
MSFRLVLASLLLLLALAPGTVMADLFEQITEQARERAAHDYVPPATELAQPLAAMNYEQYRSIRFRPEAALWRDQALFEVQLFHPGFLYQKSVRIHVVHNGRVEPLPFDQEAFRYEGAAAELTEAVTPELGHAGFRLHFPLNRAVYKDEFAVFLGASYFRLVGRGQVLRPLRPRAGHRHRPDPRRGVPRLPRVLAGPGPPRRHPHDGAGAARQPLAGRRLPLRHRPGATYGVEVTARLFARRDVEQARAGPLTSMFAHGDTTPARRGRPSARGARLRRPADAHRPGEWIWRPLTNPRELRVSSLLDRDPRGFGLVQRERDFDRYLDLEARYERRPSQWVEPLDRLGRGRRAAGGDPAPTRPTTTSSPSG